MQSFRHQLINYLVQFEPEVMLDVLLPATGIQLPPWDQVQVGSPDLSDEERAAELRGDTVLEFLLGPLYSCGIEIEVQVSPDPRRQKERVLLAYLANLRNRLAGSPVFLIVITTSRAIATAFRRPIPMGHPGLVLTPLVVGPDEIPVVTNREEARQAPSLAILSALAHPRATLPVLPTALAALPRPAFRTINPLLLGALSPANRRQLEALMSKKNRLPEIPAFIDEMFLERDRAVAEGIAEGKAKGIAEGKAEGKAEGVAKGEARAVIEFLMARGITVPVEARRRIFTCTDLGRLGLWIRRAAKATSLEEVLADGVLPDEVLTDEVLTDEVLTDEMFADEMFADELLAA